MNNPTAIDHNDDKPSNAATTTSSSSSSSSSSGSLGGSRKHKHAAPRSMYTPSPKDSKSLLGRAAHKHSEVRQRSLRSAQSQRAKGLTPPVHVGSFDDNDDTVLLGTADEFLYDSWNGFVGGDFASGKIRHIQTDGSCWALAYSKRADMLAVGLPDGRVDILETSHYTTLCRIEPGGGGRGDGSGGSSGGVRYRGKISAIEWCPHAQTLGGTVQDGGELVAIADLEGNVSLYRIDITRVEFEGVQLLYEFEVGAQVRCMALKRFLVPNDKEIKNVLVLTVGDTNGRITICTLDCQVDITASMVTMEVLNDKILGLDVHPEKMILVYGTKDGWVVVRNLEWQYINHWQVVCSDNIVWKTARNGQVRAVKMTDDGSYALFGGYDKRLCVYDSKLFAVIQEMPLDGTINTIALDPLDRYYVVGCRDKSLTLFDTSTFKPVKQFPTPGWVTSISWGVPGVLVDVVAVRSETEGITLFDMTPVHLMDRSLSGDEKSDASSVSWSPDGTYLARLVGNSIRIANSSYAFRRTCDMHIRNGALRCIQFSPVFEEHREGKDDKEQEASFLASVGLDGYLRLFRFVAPGSLELVQSTYVENDLWVVAWSSDGNQLAVGGKGKTVYLYDAPSLALKVKKLFQGRIWDLAFKPLTSFRVNDEMSDNESTMQAVGYDLAVGSGEYKALLFDQDLSCPALEITRHRTVRCIDYHPSLPNLAVGDGSGTVIVVNYRHEETLVEVYVGGRVNVLRFSPCGDFLLVCTDNSMFFLYETKTYKVVQEFECNGFAVAGSFSSSGRYLALGNSIDAYMIVKLGPLLGIDHLPLTKDLPIWALQESLFRSGYGPSLIQRYMISGKQTGMKWVAATFKQYPDAVYTFDRHRGEDCFATALRCREIKLLQLAITTVVDGSLDAENDRQSILTTKIPERARLTIQVMVESHPPEYTVAILNALTFIKVPFTRQHLLRNDKRMTCARSSYVDPWDRFPFKESVEDDADYTVRTSAVLPIPGLGTMNFLSWLVARAPAEAFDNEAMAVVLKVMWRNHIQKYFLLDMIFYISYYTVWIFLIDLNWRKYTAALAIALMVMNTALLCREILQSNLRWNYFISGWNQIDLVAIGLVYGHTIPASTNQNVDNQVPLSVVTTLLLTMKLLSYLRGFHATSWLVTVLAQNFYDVRGFLLVLFTLLVGFAVCFQLLFHEEETFRTVRESLLSTFELTILGQYETSWLHNSEHPTLSAITFVLAVTSILVVVLNALISLLGDSYARVQENAIANQRKEKAELIVEYMSLLTPWRRRKMEKDTRFFHALLQADADGDLIVEDESWEGGLKALMGDIEESNEKHALSHQKAIENLKQEFDRELSAMRTEMLSILRDLSDDIKTIKKAQTTSSSGGTTGSKRVAVAVRSLLSPGLGAKTEKGDDNY